MTLTEWRQNDKLRQWYYALTQTPEWQLLMQCMENSHVRHFQLSPVGPNDSDRVIRLGKIEGWDLYANTLNSAMALPAEQKDIGPPTFDDPSKDEPSTK